MSGVAGLRVTFVTYYWRPYLSGLTVCVSRVAEALVRAGAEVTALVARHDRDLPAAEHVDGVSVRRLAVAGRFDRAPLVPGLVRAASREARAADVVVVVSPLAEAGLVARLARRHARVVLHHICDPDVPGGPAGRLAIRAVDASTRAAVAAADLVLATSDDYARHSRVLASVADRVVAIPPPIVAPPLPPRGERPDGRTIGYLGRLTHEKGLDRLIRAAARLETPATVVLAGPTEVAGGSEADALRALAARLGVDVRVPGPLPDEEVGAFYASLDAFALPSVNTLEAWGMVQAEAMLCGTPVVASALPGMREVVARTGMGETVPPDDVAALAAALERVLAHPARYRRSREHVVAALGLDTALDRYIDAFARVAESA